MARDERGEWHEMMMCGMRSAWGAPCLSIREPVKGQAKNSISRIKFRGALLLDSRKSGSFLLCSSALGMQKVQMVTGKLDG